MDDHTNTVRKWRRWHELSQQELADRVGVSRQTIANVERGNYSPSVYLAPVSYTHLTLPTNREV